MWSQATRKVLISSVYEYLFWQKLEDPKEFVIDWSQLTLEHFNEGDVLNQKEFQKVFNTFLSLPDKYLSQVSKFINDWSKTFDLVKAILIVFVIELESFQDEPPKNIISKYIRITQELVGGENPSLVHAVTSKILNQSGL
ncbi:MAG: hypothetical protein HC932_05655 [Thermales bacterium]|nr:hypothetical protein [Thermales bacterium]